jgi:hypothetical protein
MLVPVSQFVGGCISIFRGDIDISILRHPAVYSLRPTLVSVVAICGSNLFEPLCAQKIWVSRFSQHRVLSESLSDVGHFAACSMFD